MTQVVPRTITRDTIRDHSALAIRRHSEHLIHSTEVQDAPTTETWVPPASEGVVVERVLGSFGEEPWPRLVAVVGVHGNEPAGVHAAKRVLRRLRTSEFPIRGRLVCLAGNVEALRRGVRYQDVDLNRVWTSLSERPWPAAQTPGAAEMAERRALASALDEALAVGRRPADGDVRVIDMHTTSSVSAPFVLFTDRLSNRAMAHGLGVPMILGLEEELAGTVLDHLDGLGVTAVTVEGGQHDAPESVDRLEALLWLALDEGGQLPEGPPEGRARWQTMLSEATTGLPRLFEVRHRHAIDARDRFQMDPGHFNFEPVQAGQRLAEDRHGAVHAEQDGRLFMPLYQPQGEDGYFLARKIRYLWLPISSWLRRVGADRLMPLMPGVALDPDRPGVLAVDTRVAWLLPLQLLHLLGYRKLRWTGRRLVAARRPHDTPVARPEVDTGQRVG